jgi:hypothetical protein
MFERLFGLKPEKKKSSIMYSSIYNAGPFIRLDYNWNTLEYIKDEVTRYCTVKVYEQGDNVEICIYDNDRLYIPIVEKHTNQENKEKTICAAVKEADAHYQKYYDEQNADIRDQRQRTIDRREEQERKVPYEKRLACILKHCDNCKGDD